MKNLALIITAILTVIGIVSWGFQLALGPSVLAINQTFPWGVYVVTFFVLAGTACGLVIMAALGALGILPGVNKYRRPLYIAAIACFIAAGVIIVFDMGRPERVFSMLVRPNVDSMLVWDMYLLAASVVLALICAFLKAGKVLPIITGIFGLAVVLLEGMILTLSPGNPVWQSALIPALFLVEGLIGAITVVLVVKAKPREDKALPQILAALLAIMIILIILLHASGTYMGNTETAAGLALMVSGSLAPLFWSQAIICIVFPLVMLIVHKNDTITKTAAVLAFIGIFMNKLVLMLAGQAIPSMGVGMSYAPSIVEIGGLIGAFGLAAFLFALGYRILASRTAKKPA